MQKIDIESVKSFLLSLQDSICSELEQVDAGKKFVEDRWDRPQGGFGVTRVLDNGTVFEKAGVNFSHVYGDNLPPSASASRPELAGRSFQAMGVSLVIHPHNPHVPTSHANIRFFIAAKEGEEPIWWFGGGLDLTPYYGYEEDCQHWHQSAFESCRDFPAELYPKFKKWCDDYFHIKHRNEARGVGGLFYDDFNELGFEQSFALTQSVGKAFTKAYVPIVEKRKNSVFNDQQRDFQLHRRGRYVEFNLVYDRGTLFGLQSNGRTESILMSLPPLVKWSYDYQIEEGSREQELLTKYLKPRDWL